MHLRAFVFPNTILIQDTYTIQLIYDKQVSSQKKYEIRNRTMRGSEG
jgi:hypothetical protein